MWVGTLKRYVNDWPALTSVKMSSWVHTGDISKPWKCKLIDEASMVAAPHTKLAGIGMVVPCCGGGTRSMRVMTTNSPGHTRSVGDCAPVARLL